MVINIYSVVQLAVLLGLLIVVSCSDQFSWSRASKNKGLILVGLLGLANLFVFGVAHDNEKSRLSPLNLHDSYHYLLSAKYFDELGYQQIYQCTVEAFHELQEGGAAVPTIFSVRDLNNRFQSISADNVVCSAEFSKQRWASFKSDLQGFLTFESDDTAWQKMLLDNGNNPPPSWALPASLFVWWVPLDSLNIQLLTRIDLVLILVLLPLLIFRSGRTGEKLGDAALFVALLVSTWFLAPSWVLGSYAREIWLFSLLLGVIAWRKSDLVWAGLWLGLAAWLRVFPVLFLIPAILLLSFWGDRFKFVIGVALVSLLQVASLVVFGLDVWIVFFNNLLTHGSLPALNHLGYYQLVTQTLVVNQVQGDFPTAIFADLHESIKITYQQNAGFHGVIKLAVLALACLVCVKSRINADRTHQISIVLFVGICLLFFFVNIAHYYYVMLVAFFWLTALQDSTIARTVFKINGILMVAVITVDLVPRPMILLFSLQNAIMCFWVVTVLFVYSWYGWRRNEW